MMISERLRQIADMCGSCRLVADVGCDHGYAAAWLLKEGRAESAYCMDLRKGPLERARETLLREGLADRAELIQSDGLRAIAMSPEYQVPDTVIISGMGGQLITDILSLKPTDGKTDPEGRFLSGKAESYLKQVGRLVLSPQSEPEILRHYLTDRLGFLIREERMLKEEGKYYVILSVCPKEPADREAYRTEADYRYGTLLPASGDPVFREFLTWEKGKTEELLEKLAPEKGEGAERRKQELLKQLSEIAPYLA